MPTNHRALYDLAACINDQAQAGVPMVEGHSIVAGVFVDTALAHRRQPA
jgi:hypothetical protein